MLRQTAFRDLPKCGVPAADVDGGPTSSTLNELTPFDWDFFCTQDAQWFGKYIRLKRVPHPEYLFQYHLGKKTYNPKNDPRIKTHTHVSFFLYESFHLAELLSEVVPQIDALNGIKPKTIIPYFEQRSTLKPTDVYSSDTGKAFWDTADLALSRLRCKLVLDEKSNTYRLYFNNRPTKGAAENFSSWCGPVNYITEYEMRLLLEYIKRRNNEQELVLKKTLFDFWKDEDNSAKGVGLIMSKIE